MSKSVFISHATKDKSLVEAVVDLIEDGIGVPESEIFCSSLDGYGIPTGENFVTYIKSQIQEPKAVILLLTPSYFKSNFCLCEMGAAWVKSHKVFPVIVPPLMYSDVKDVLLGTQAAKIDDDIKYNELREHLIDNISFVAKTNTKWDTKRKVFLKKLPGLLDSLSIPENVSPNEHAALKAQLEEAQSSLTDYEEEVQKIKSYVKKLELVKDKGDVKTLKQEFKETEIAEEFESLLDEIKEFKSLVGSSEVLKFILSCYYDKPYKINHYNFGDDFANAARYNFIDLEDSEKVNWSNKHMKKLNNKLDALQKLIYFDERSEELAHYFSEEYDIPLESDNQEFWEYNYDI
ncbi:toll/interleukin-1 receptor domain-containing protein [Aeromonas dhakensis]|uniref:toll/interleukin-1 receptor domain-containing protein n=1 Tax=Aeromonas dhakensis TaxID=196024 RepID=UPI001396AC29|nr:toll/interleukin-1 receptor domain-containing protein [Aeromonas dhakensis]